jgi:hypothetical protein
MQAVSENGLLRGAQAIADYLNAKMIGGQPVTRAAVYRMAAGGKLPVTRLGSKGTEIWARSSAIDKLLGLEPDEETAREAA